MVVIQTDRVEVSKTFLGGLKLRYACPGCKAALFSRRSEIGVPDHCPFCKSKFMLSAEIENRLHFEEATVTAAIERKKSDKRQQKEQRRREARYEKEQRHKEFEKEIQEGRLKAQSKPGMEAFESGRYSIKRPNAFFWQYADNGYTFREIIEKFESGEVGAEWYISPYARSERAIRVIDFVRRLSDTSATNPQATWYFNRDGESRGPLSESEMQIYVSEGTIRKSDLVWKHGMADWIPAARVNDFFPLDATPPRIPEQQQNDSLWAMFVIVLLALMVLGSLTSGWSLNEILFGPRGSNHPMHKSNR